jgi:hypothetical protein
MTKDAMGPKDGVTRNLNVVYYDKTFIIEEDSIIWEQFPLSPLVLELS